MEKNTVNKAELTAVAGVITMDLDPEALNCPKCLHPRTSGVPGHISP
jgi:hypothetical protein